MEEIVITNHAMEALMADHARIRVAALTQAITKIAQIQRFR